MTLRLEFRRVPDPEGHGAALLLKGDWLFVGVSDGRNAGWGEASLSGDDDACERAVRDLFDLAARVELSVAGIAAFRDSWSGRIDSFVTATAASALEQALHELVAVRAGVPVWTLYAVRPARAALPAYVTINRALSARDAADYVSTVELAFERGFTQVKCAPFERVTHDGDQIAQAQQGLAMLRLLRDRFPRLDLRVDCHERFAPDAFLEMLPLLEQLRLTWIEAPCPIGPAYVELRERAQTPIAAGELFFGSQPFAEICENGWTDVIMPDVKHIGGLGPLLEVCELASKWGIEVSLHNASGPIATVASVHCGALSPAVTSIELALRRREHPSERLLVQDGEMTVPDGRGWGLGAGWRPLSSTVDD